MKQRLSLLSPLLVFPIGNSSCNSRAAGHRYYEQLQLCSPRFRICVLGSRAQIGPYKGTITGQTA